jgi:hypothetical protein
VSSRKLYEEIVQFDVGAPTFEDFRNASGPGKIYPKGAHVMVRCVVTDGPVEAAVSANGKWYLTDEKQKGRKMFTPANVYINGSDLSLPLNQQNEVDPNVPHCSPEDLASFPIPSSQPVAGRAS